MSFIQLAEMTLLYLSEFTGVDFRDLLIADYYQMIQVCARPGIGEIGRAGEHRFTVANDKLLMKDFGVEIRIDLNGRSEKGIVDVPVDLKFAPGFLRGFAGFLGTKIVQLQNQSDAYTPFTGPQDRIRDFPAVEFLDGDVKPFFCAVDKIDNGFSKIIRTADFFRPHINLDISNFLRHTYTSLNKCLYRMSGQPVLRVVILYQFRELQPPRSLTG